MSAERAKRTDASPSDASPVTAEAAELTVVAAADAARADWDGFVSTAAQAELYHDYRWRGLIEDVFGHECHYLLARERSGSVRGALPLVRLRSRLFGNFLVSMPYFNYASVLGDSARARDALVAASAAIGRSLGVGHIELRGRAHQDLDLPVREDKVSMRLELPTSAEELFKRFDSKLRAQIRRPQKVGATSRLGGAELLDDFYRVFAINMRDLGTPVYPRRFFAAIVAMFPEEANVCVVYLKGKPAAAGLVLRHRGTLEIPWASSLREANRDGVNMLLYWSVLEHAIASGCKTFDFGRSSKESGAYRFKQQWGAVPEQLRWHYWLSDGAQIPQITPNNPKYRIAISVWKRLPVSIANVLGPHIVKNLP